MKVFITGNQGFVGTETQKVFENKGIEVIGYDIMDGYDIRDIGQLEKKIQETKPDRILHLAATARFSEADKDPILAFQTNAWGTFNLGKIADKYHIPIVYSSTGSVYMPIDLEPPITEEFPARGNSVYAVSKYVGECYIQSFKNPYIILRYAHLYGKEKRFHGLIGGILKRLERGLAPTLYGGKQSNDFTYGKDVANANYLAVTASWDKWNNIYNIGTGEEISAEDAAEIICQLTGYKGQIEKKEMRTVDPIRFVYNCSKAETMLGFKAKFNFRDGLTDMFKEIKNESIPEYLGRENISTTINSIGSVR